MNPVRRSNVPTASDADARAEGAKQAEILNRYNVTMRGQGTRPLLFAHGFGTDQKVWRFVAPHFEADYRTILFDHAGCGRSLKSAYDEKRHGELSGYVDDLLLLCRTLTRTPVVLVAHSVSCMIGLLASIREPALFECLILVAPSARYLNEPPDYHGGFEPGEVSALLDMMDQNFLGWADTFAGVAAKEPELTKELFDGFCSADPRTIRRFAEVTFNADVRADLPRVTTPSLILQCEDDAIVPVVVGEYLRDHLGSSSYRVLPVAGHCPHVSTPQIIIAAIEEFLSRLPETRAN